MIGTMSVYTKFSQKSVKGRAEKMGLDTELIIQIQDFNKWTINPLIGGHSRVDHLTSTLLPSGAIMIVTMSRSDGAIRIMTDSSTAYILTQMYPKASQNYYIGRDVLLVPLEDFKEKFKIHKSPLRR